MSSNTSHVVGPDADANILYSSSLVVPQFYYGGLQGGNVYPALRELEQEIVESDVDLLSLSRFMHVYI